VSWRMALVGQQDAPMNIFGHNWHEAIAAAVHVAVSAQPASVEPNGKAGKPATCASMQPAALSTACLMLVMPSPTGSMHAPDASDERVS
jgi:hypothetical protein